MCRFLLVKSKNPISPKHILTKFANMAEKSKALDGDWQGDGWGVAWVDKENNWQVKKSLAPIWQEQNSFDQLPACTTFVAHARSASFPQHKGNVAFNQPYITEKYAFVFNGLLRGVSLPNIPGRIGAEKIWYILRQELKNTNPQDALKKTQKMLVDNAKEIVALNLGLMDLEDMFSVNYFTRNPEYYQLHHHKTPDVEITCSEHIDWE